MIACIIIVSLAFLWLGYESKWMTIRLVAYSKPLQSNSSGLETQSNSVALRTTKPTDDNNDTTERNPVTFIKLDMPDTQGNITILCKRC